MNRVFARWIDPGAIAQRSEETDSIRSLVPIVRIVQAVRNLQCIAEGGGTTLAELARVRPSAPSLLSLERRPLFSALFENRRKDGEKQDSCDDAERNANGDFVKVGDQHLRADETKHEG